MALLLASFGSSNLTEKEDEENKIAEAIDRIQRFFRFLIAFTLRVFQRKKQILKDTIFENAMHNGVGDNKVCIHESYSYSIKLHLFLFS